MISWIAAVALLWVVYAVWVTRLLHRLLSRDLFYLDRLEPNTVAQCQAAARYDCAHLSRWKLHLGAAFLLPIRMLLSLPILLLWFLFAWIPKSLCSGSLL